MGAAQSKTRAALHAARDPEKLIAFKDIISSLIDRRVLKANINDSVDSEAVLGLCTRQVTDKQRENGSEFFHRCSGANVAFVKRTTIEPHTTVYHA